MSRLLHEPTIRLRSLGEERGHASLELVRELFGLREDAPAQEQAPAAELAEVHELRRRRSAPGAARRADADRHAAQRARAGTGRAGRARAARRRARSFRCSRAGTAVAARPATRQVPLGARARGRARRGRDRPRGALRQGRPGELPTGLELLGAPERAAAEDVLCGAARSTALPARRARGHEQHPPRSRSCAPRARTSSRWPIRGNVDTRLRKLARPGESASTRSCSRAPGCSGWDASAEAGGDARPRALRAGARTGSARARGRAATMRARARRWQAITDDDAFACLLAERALARELGAELPHAAGRTRRARRRRLPAPARVGGAARRLGVGGDELLGARPSIPRRSGASGAAAGARSAARSCCGRPRRWRRDERARYLVGAGPGDPGLLTARALELIATRRRDPVRPPDPERGARRRARGRRAAVRGQGGRRAVGAAGADRGADDRARAGRAAMVVRLKGGDPFVFGRGGEEALALRAAGIPFEVVPGVTAGVAASAYAGIPVTHRGARERGRARHRTRAHDRGGGAEATPERPGAGAGLRLAGAGRLPGHARAVHGGAPAGADRGGADRGRAPGRRSRRPSWKRGRCPGSARSADAARRSRRARARAGPRAVDHRRRAGGGARASSSRGWPERPLAGR